MAAIRSHKRPGESTSSFIYRFSKRVQQSGVLKEAKKRRFHHRVKSKAKRRVSALYRVTKKKEMARLKKLGLI